MKKNNLNYKLVLTSMITGLSVGLIVSLFRLAIPKFYGSY